jgi:hypothetical protein
VVPLFSAVEPEGGGQAGEVEDEQGGHGALTLWSGRHQA